VGSTNITLTALWIADVYTVIYDWNGSTGTSTSASTYIVGTSSDISLPSQGNQVKTNYSFDGWSLTRNGIKLSGSTLVPAASATLYARWVIDLYTVTYNAQGGTGIPSSVTADVGSSVTLPRPTRNHYVFLGWYDASTGGSLVSLADVSYTPNTSITLHARWRQSSLTGFTDAQLTRVFPTAKASSSEDRTFSFNTSGGYGMSVFVPKEALPNNTELGFYLAASPSATAKSALSGTINYVLSVVIAWTDPTGDVPDTPPGSPILVTITDSKIKAGAIVYSQLAGRVVELGRATQNGSVTVSITSDPEIFVVQSKPTTPTGVSATDSVSGVSTVTWSAPSDMGGSDLIFYTVMTSGVEVCRTSQTSCLVNGLNDMSRYSFTVTATNSVGTSDASAVSNLINPPTATLTPPPLSSQPVVILDLPRPPFLIPDNEKVDETKNKVEIDLKETSILVEASFQFAANANNTEVKWIVAENAIIEKYLVTSKGKILCETTKTACTISGLLGGNSDLKVVAVTSTSSEEVAATYIASTKFRLVGRIYFPAYSIKISNSYLQKIGVMANFVRDQGFSEILVTGHSDRTLMANLTTTSFLSTERARVAASAIKKLLPSVTMKYLGQGNASPLVDGVFKNVKNRRVQIYTR
jgi:hypothetical protein